MKKSFYLSLFALTLFTASVFAQSPGGLGGSVLWLKANSGATVSSWTDASGSGNSFAQPTPANQPVLGTNVFNFNEALGFNGSTTYMTQPTPTGFPEFDANRTIFVVAKGTGVPAYQWIFVYGTPGSGGPATFQVGNHDGLCNAFYGSELTTFGYWNSAANTNGAMSSFTLNASTGTQYDRGTSINTGTFGGLLNTSVNGIIGNLSAASAEAWDGSIGEIILFPSALSNADRNRVESYLALKYGFTLGSNASPLSYTAADGTTVYWTGSAFYQNDVFGIGTDAAGTGLTQLQSNSMNSGSGDGTGQSGKGNLVLSVPVALSDNQFLMIGNDADVLTEHVIAVGEAPPASEGSQRVGRNWKVQNTGAVGAVNLSFDVTGLTFTGGSTPANYRLLVDADGDGDYTTGTQSYITPVSFTGNKLNFSGVTFANGAVFTLITQVISATLPAVWQGFTVSLQKNTATLTWKTSSEINVDHYTAEYSANGISYQPLGTVAAKNTAGLNTYTLTQSNLPLGIRYYRIRRVDKDGKSDISTVKSIRTGGLNTVVLKSNPVVRGRLELNIDVNENQEAVIRVVSTSGRVLVQQNTGLTSGTNAVTTNIAHLAAGTYFLQVQLTNETINKKFVRL